MPRGVRRADLFCHHHRRHRRFLQNIFVFLFSLLMSSFSWRERMWRNVLSPSPRAEERPFLLSPLQTLSFPSLPFSLTTSRRPNWTWRTLGTLHKRRITSKGPLNVFLSILFVSLILEFCFRRPYLPTISCSCSLFFFLLHFLITVRTVLSIPFLSFVLLVRRG